MRTGLALAIALLAPGLALAWTAPRFPKKVAGYNLAGTRDFETRSPGLGYNASYRSGGAMADVFIYTLGRPDLPQTYDAGETRRQLELAADDVDRAARQQIYRAATRGQGFSVVAGQGLQFDCAAFTLINQNAEHLDNLLCVTTRAGAFIKVRISGPEGRLGVRAARPFLEAWLQPNKAF